MLRRLAIFPLLLAAGLAAAQTAPAPRLEEKDLPKTQYYLGVAVENIPPAMARQLKLQKNQGLLVVAVLKDSPAAAANLQPDDLLTEIDGRPLSSQEDLSRAANRFVGDAGGPRVKPARLALLREGERRLVDITPAPRPAGLQVMGPDLQNFTPNLSEDPANVASRVRNYALPNGATVQVGIGYRFDLNSGDATSKSIRGVVNRGQPLVLSHETDAAGNTRHSITVGTTTYEVTKEKLGDIPAEIRPIAEQLLKVPPQQVAGRRNKTMEDRIADLEQSNNELRQSNRDLRDQINRLLQVLGSSTTAPATRGERP